MSYCHLINPGGEVNMAFRPRLADTMYSVLDRAGCATVPSSPLLRLQTPYGGEQYNYGEMLQIDWAYARVNSVTIEYSPDNGSSWLPIATDINPSQRTFSWAIPNQFTNEALIRIYGDGNQSLGDTSVANFTIIAPDIAIQFPRLNSEVSQGATIAIRWTSSLVESVNVEISYDDGANWEVLTTDLTDEFLNVTAPTIETKNARVRISDAGDSGVISISDPFAIGIPSLTVIEPNSTTAWEENERETIRWNASFVDNVRIEYSTDSLESWKRVTFTTDASNGEREWTVADEPTENAFIRFVSRDQTNLNEVIGISERFTITQEVVSVEEQISSMEPVNLSVEPNPANGRATVRYTLPQNVESLSITLVDLQGNKLMTIAPSQASQQGEWQIPFSVAGITQGVYFVVINADGVSTVQKLQVVQ
jgi:hypothetical protein